MHENDAGHSVPKTAVLACAVAGLVGLVLAGCERAPLAAMAAVGRRPGSPVPAAAIPRLRAIASHYARGDSLIAPQWASVVATSHKKALACATPAEEATLGVGNVKVYLITMKGRFVPLPVASPVLPGKGPAPGNYLAIVVDAKTFRVIDLGLRAKPPEVAPASLGPVTYLTHLAGS